MVQSSEVLPHPAACAAFYELLPGGRVRFTCFAKVTYELKPSASTYAAYQEPLYATEQRWELRYRNRIDRAADIRPARPRIDVVLLAPPSGFPGAPVRFALGAVDCAQPRPSSDEPNGGAGPFGPKSVRNNSLETVAPIGQQLDAFSANEPLSLENVLKSAARLTTKLPSPGLTGLVSSVDKATFPIVLRPSLVTLDAERETSTITYRGELESDTWPSTVRVAIANRDGASLAVELRPLQGWGELDNPSGPDSLMVLGSPNAPEARSNDEVTSFLYYDAVLPTPPAVPFGGSAPLAPSSEDAPKRSPFVDLASLRAELDRSIQSAAHRTEMSRETRGIELPSLADRPTAMAGRPVAPGDGHGVSKRSLSALLRQPIGPSAVVADVPEPMGQDDDAPPSGELDVPLRRLPLEFLWLDSASHPRLRKHDEWKSVLPPPPARPAPKRGEPPPPPPSGAELEAIERADAMALLSQPEERPLLLDAESTRTASDGSGALLQLVTGTLALPFDEFELLKVTIAVARPLAASDKALRDRLDVTSVLLENPLAVTPETALIAVKQVRDAWRAANRTLPPEFLVTQAERVLLTERKYQRRKLLGNDMLRAWFTSRELANGLPAYLPAQLDKRLPLFPELPVRAIVELLPKQDTYEARPLALRIVALSRVLEDAPSGASSPNAEISAARAIP